MPPASVNSRTLFWLRTAFRVIRGDSGADHMRRPCEGYCRRPILKCRHKPIARCRAGPCVSLTPSEDSVDASPIGVIATSIILEAAARPALLSTCEEAS